LRSVDGLVRRVPNRNGPATGRGVLYLVVSVLLLVGAVLLSSSPWVSGVQTHTLLEVGAHLISLFVALIAFVRFYTRPKTTFLFVAAAFLSTAFLDGYHALVTSSYMADVLPSASGSLVAWSWLAPRLSLSVFLWLSYLVWRREERLGPAGEPSHRLIYGSAAVLTLASFALFAVVPLPPAYYPNLPVPRPQELLPAVFFLLAAVSFFRRGDWRHDAFDHGLMLSLIIGFFAQAAYMAWARQNHDAMFDAAHVLKNLSYGVVLVALLIEASHVYRREEQSVYDIRSVNASLGQEITERRRAEAAREDLEGQLRQAQKLEAVGQLAGGIAHDFNNVLTAVAGYAQLGLRRVDGNDPLAEDLRSVMECSERGAKLVQQLLAFSRRQSLRPSIFNLNPLVQRSAGLIRRLIHEDVELRIEQAPELGNVHADSNQIEQVLVNLVVNACDAMPNGGMLTIATQQVELGEAEARRLGELQAGPHASLSVIDTGIGMDEPTRERVFEPFFTTKEVGKGTGLGLATTYGIVRQHRGAIVVDSSPGQGATFRIFLPCVDGKAADPDPANADETLGVDGAETVLLVEDEAMVRDVAVRFLEQHGYTVITAAHPEDAEKLYREHSNSIDLLVTDIVMPGFNGRELYFRLARYNPDLKVLFMSGYADEAFTTDESARLASSFIQKPFAPVDFLAKVRRLLDG